MQQARPPIKFSSTSVLTKKEIFFKLPKKQKIVILKETSIYTLELKPLVWKYTAPHSPLHHQVASIRCIP